MRTPNLKSLAATGAIHKVECKYILCKESALTYMKRSC
jgi:hypothetical protein